MSRPWYIGTKAIPIPTAAKMAITHQYWTRSFGMGGVWTFSREDCTWPVSTASDPRQGRARRSAASSHVDRSMGRPDHYLSFTIRWKAQAATCP
jgi:hypothetical protein